jgi:flagellar basal-body rod protein FlgC
MDINKAIAISSAGMDVQTERLRVIAENLANQDSTGSTPGAAPYRRKTVTFEDRLDKELGVDTVQVGSVGTDQSPFTLRYDPSHPAADANGYVQMPNVNPFVEIMDMREAERGYSANLNVMEVTRDMITRTIGLLK